MPTPEQQYYTEQRLRDTQLAGEGDASAGAELANIERKLHGGATADMSAVGRDLRMATPGMGASRAAAASDLTSKRTGHPLDALTSGGLLGQAGSGMFGKAGSQEDRNSAIELGVDAAGMYGAPGAASVARAEAGAQMGAAKAMGGKLLGMFQRAKGAGAVEKLTNMAEETGMPVKTIEREVTKAARQEASQVAKKAQDFAESLVKKPEGAAEKAVVKSAPKAEAAATKAVKPQSAGAQRAAKAKADFEAKKAGQSAPKEAAGKSGRANAGATKAASKPHETKSATPANKASGGPKVSAKKWAIQRGQFDPSAIKAAVTKERMPAQVLKAAKAASPERAAAAQDKWPDMTRSERTSFLQKLKQHMTHKGNP